MLGSPTPPPLTLFDLQCFDAFVPQDHDLRKALELIPWDDWYETLAPAYSPNRGRPSAPPVMMLKFEYLRYHYNLSDRQVIERTKTDLAFRLFLQVDVNHLLVDPSDLTRFRARLGIEGFRRVFDQTIAHARAAGLVKERLRLKDASHVLANIDVPCTLALVSQIRDKLLAAAEPFDALRVAGERVEVELLRERTNGLTSEASLLARVTHLQDILAWAEQLPQPEDSGGRQLKLWQTLQTQIELTRKILFDQDHPQAGDKTRSTVDPEARRSKHGDWYDGYVIDILMDADSELITQVNVLPTNAEEAADAARLIEQEEAVHGNDIEGLSIDGAGWDGEVLRELQDPDGLALDVTVPPRKEPETELFTAEKFVEDAEAGTVTCPAGKTSSYRQRNQKNTGTMYRFQAFTCAGCPLASQCLSPQRQSSQSPFGRTVTKNDYQEEYRRAREKATTAAYEATRREHLKVERKLGEVMNRHGGRRARYWGQAKVLIQELMACQATNVKRMIKLLSERELSVAE